MSPRLGGKLNQAKEDMVDAVAAVTSKGQVTIPKPIRDESKISEGDQLVFRATDHGAVVIRVPDVADLAGSLTVVGDKRGLAWAEVLAQARESRARRLSR